MSTQSVSDFVKSFMTHPDPLLPTLPNMNGLVCEDHITFVVSPEKREAFQGFWKERGFEPHPTAQYTTVRYPAKHIVLTLDPNANGPCEKMIGLSMSSDIDSPITRCLKLCGEWRMDGKDLTPGRLQHIAYAVDSNLDINEVCENLGLEGVKFMTPVLSWTDKVTRGELKQAFVACKVPWGPFIEIIQRRGDFRNFSREQIDKLYQHYDTYSRDPKNF